MVHLHMRSAYTLLQSTVRIEESVAKAKEMGMSALALTDKNVMHGVPSFVRACQKFHIKPIIGLECDAYDQENQFSFVLLAKNDNGYKNLLKLSTRLNTSKEKLSLEELKTFSQDNYVLLSFDHSSFDAWLIQEDELKMIETLTLFHQSFDDFVCGIAMNDSGLLRLRNQHLKQLCIANGIDTVALSRIYMLNQEDEESYKVLCAIQQGVTVQDKTLNVAGGRYMRTPSEMSALYEEDDCRRSERIAEACNVTFEFSKSHLPAFQNRFHVSSQEYLKSLCYKGLEKRLNTNHPPKNYVNRLKYELDVIAEMHYEDYFLIVYDFIRYAKSQKIYVGPGRGSAPGSLVAYCLGITQLDPLRYHLFFERFLNPERISLPDIDTDFPDNHRDDVIAYVREKYGHKRVAHIVTFGTLAARAVLRDVGKAIGLPLYDIDMICKSVPMMLNNRKVTLPMAYEMVPRFRQFIESKTEYQKLYRIALQLEGLPRHSSLHAAGIVLSNQSIEEVCPLMECDEGVYATQYTMENLEELGLIKMDFLAIRNLTIIDEIVQNIIAHEKADFDIMKIPLNDAKTFACLKEVDTAGIFQLESEGMKNLCRKMQPQSYEEIAAMIALFRPGPMENIPLYLENRRHPENIVYLHEDLREILAETYGVILYQEQIMQIATKMAGFSLAKADTLRYAMSKKKVKELESLKEEFIAGSIAKGYERELAVSVYELILKFANYGFNKSHSFAYGLVAYQMAYLKANYPNYFFTSLLNSVIGSESKTSEYIFEARKRGITIVNPNINVSCDVYVTVNDQVLFPLLGIRNVGSAAANAILKEREKGTFIDYFECVARLCMHRINRKTLESLIMAGAFDCFNESRASMLATLNDALRYADIVKIEDENQIFADFDLVSKPPMIAVKDTRMTRANDEKSVLGFYLSDHPMNDLRRHLQFKGGTLMENKGKQGLVTLLGTLTHIKQHRTKKGDLMAFAVLSDDTAQMDVVIMPQLYKQTAEHLIKGRNVIVHGKMDKETSCLANQIQFIDTK